MHHQRVAERVEFPDLPYLLAGDSIDDAASSALDQLLDHAPNRWWPNDRAWCVATEIDYAWTYVGGPHSSEAFLADPRLEALPARLSNKPFYDNDVLNAALDG